MASIGSKSGRLYIDFRDGGQRFREYTGVLDTPSTRKKAEMLIKRMEAELTLGTFDYSKYFPGSKSVLKWKNHKRKLERKDDSKLLFKAFAEEWFAEKVAEWRPSYRDTVRVSFDAHILPWFKDKLLDELSKADIMKFRAHLVTLPGQSEGSTLSASRINHIMTPLRMILTEAADRYEFKNPWQNIRPLKEPKTDVNPLTLQEVRLFLSKIRSDFRAYYTTRFFTGLRSSEVDGLQWKYVDFERRQILVREALVQGKLGPTKTDGSTREIDMNSEVYAALKKHREVVGDRSAFVFSNSIGNPMHNRNVTRRVWYPMLRHLGLEPRRPYQTRHTAATLWLAAGESPEWIARQMGHTTTEMLFRVYSRFVPNLTRQDGSAFERLLKAEFNNNSNPSHDSTDTASEETAL